MPSRMRWMRIFCPGRRNHTVNAAMAAPIASRMTRNCVRRKSRQPDDHPRDERQLGVEGRIEVRERRHHLQHDDRDEDERQRHEDRRVDQRRHHLALHRGDDLRVLDEAAQHRVQVAAALAGQERCRVDARKQRAVGRERVGQRRAGSHTLVHVVQHRTEDRRADPLPEEIQRLNERHPGLEERRQLLIENQKLGRRDRRPARQPHGQSRDRSLRLEREDVETFLVELVAQPGFCLGGVHALDDFAAGRCEAAAELHGLRPPGPGRKGL